MRESEDRNKGKERKMGILGIILLCISFSHCTHPSLLPSPCYSSTWFFTLSYMRCAVWLSEVCFSIPSPVYQSLRIRLAVRGERPTAGGIIENERSSSSPLRLFIPIIYPPLYETKQQRDLEQPAQRLLKLRKALPLRQRANKRV